jgi:hypothetical protein
MKTELEDAIELVANLQDVMTEAFVLAKNRHDNLKAKELRSVVEGIQLAKDALVQRYEITTQSAGEIK